MANEIILQVYFGCKCWKIFEVQELGMYFPNCPYCGCSGPIHRGQRTIKVD